jgi:hypothetical protein
MLSLLENAMCHYLRILYVGLISVERPEKVTRGGGGEWEPIKILYEGT